jgi:hypothetical protein
VRKEKLVGRGAVTVSVDETVPLVVTLRPPRE